MKTVTIANEKFIVEDKVHDLLCWYSSVVQAAELCRNSQKAYFAKQDHERLKRAKAMEKKLDQLLNGSRIDDTKQNELFR